MRTLHNTITPSHLNELFNGAKVELHEKGVLIDKLQIIKFDMESKELLLASLMLYPEQQKPFAWGESSNRWYYVFPDPLLDTPCICKKEPFQIRLSSIQ
jgi:hypothetical protein